MQYRRILTLLAVHTCLLTAAAFAQTITPTPVTITRTYTFLPVGLASTETAQVNVVNTATPPSTTSTTTPVPSCTGTISFLNASGAVIGTPTKFTVTAGEISWATLPYGSAGVTGGARTEIRGQITVTATLSATANVSVVTPCSLSYTYETYDSTTGVTHAFLAGESATVVSPLLTSGFGH